MDLTTSESVTRYLRSKDISNDDLVRTSYELIESNSEVLPNLNLFLFELIVDRLNEFKNDKFKGLKYDSKVWALFKKIWYNFDKSELKLKNNCLRKLKTSEILIDILSTSKDTVTIDPMLGAIDLVIGSSFLKISIEDSTNILKLFAAVAYDINQPKGQVLSWTEIILKIYDSSITNNSKATSKKYLNDFSSSVLPNILKLCISHKIDQQTKTLFDSLIDNILLGQDLIQFLKSNVESLVKELSEGDVSIVSYMYQFIVNKVADMALLQEIFIVINEKLPNLTLSILEPLSKSNKSLSTEFLGQLLEGKLNSKDSNKFDIIYWIIDLDLEVGYKHAGKIFEVFKNESPKQEITLPLCSKLIDSYVRAREFEQFYIAWMELISLKYKVFCSQEFLSLVSKSLSNLSTFQLDHLLKKVILPNLEGSKLTKDSKSHLISLEPVIEFATETSDSSKLVMLKKQLAIILALEPAKDQSVLEVYWKIIYLLLCLYDESDFSSIDLLQDKILLVLKNASKQLNSKIIYTYYALFRIREFYNYEVTGKMSSSFVKLLNKSDDFEFCFNRWQVIFNNFFQEKDIEIIVKNFFSYDGSKILAWKGVLNDGYIFEQSNLMKVIIDQLYTSLTNQDTRLVYLELISLIPIQCYKRATKIRMIDLLSENVTKSTSSDIKLASLSIIDSLLELPTFKSKIEMDLDIIFNMAELNTPNEVLTESTKVISKVLRHHFTQSQDSIHKSWIESLEKRLDKFYKKSANKKLSKEHFITAIILNHNDIENFKGLSNQFQTSIIHFLSVFAKNLQENFASISWILDKLYEEDIGYNCSSLKKSLKSIGNSSSELSQNVFRVLCKISDVDYDDIVYMMTLYLVIESDDCKIDGAMKLYLKRLTYENFLRALDFLLASFVDIESDQLKYFVLLQDFIETVGHHKKEENYRSLQHYLTLALSTLLSTDFKSDATTDIILNCLKLILTEINWATTQYSFELIISLITKITNSIKRDTLEVSANIYVLNTQVLSSILLFHRHRLSNRHHLVMNSFTALMECLFYRKNEKTYISGSVQCGNAFQRLLSNLIEPGNIPQSTSTNQLSSLSTLLKKSLRSYLPVIIINYVHLQIRFNMDTKVREEVLNGIFVVFDTLTESEMVVINNSLDLTGKSYFKKLYEDYKKYGKWQEDV